MAPLLTLLLLLSIHGLPATSDAHDTGQEFFQECPPTSCSRKGPTIRFPFRLITQPSFCGLAGYDLSCSGVDTIIRLPSSGDYFVRSIDYPMRTISLLERRRSDCPVRLFMSLNRSGSVLDRSTTRFKTYTIVKCAGGGFEDSMIGPVDCLRDDRRFVYVTNASSSMNKLPPGCSTVENFRAGYESNLLTGEIVEDWKTLDGCYSCEYSKKFCGFNATTNQTICYNPSNKSFRHIIIIGTTVGGTLLLLLVMFLVYRHRKSKKDKKTQLKLEEFLANYNSHNLTRYTFSDLKKIAERFKHRIGEGGYGIVYRGRLANGIPVAVKMLRNSKQDGRQFINEVASISKVHHFNVVRLLGFCYEGTRCALVYEFMLNGSLDKFLLSKEVDSTHKPLSWETLQQIASGIARGIEYLHQGCSQRILHFDIKPHNILLDHEFRPKISDFGLSKLCSRDQSFVSMTGARGTDGYIAPEVLSRNFGEVSDKSDVYSFGMLLLEMVRSKIEDIEGGREEERIAESIYDRLNRKEELGVVVETKVDEGIAKRLAIVSLLCVQWNPKDRPPMKTAVKMMEGDLEHLQLPQHNLDTHRTSWPPQLKKVRRCPTTTIQSSLHRCTGPHLLPHSLQLQWPTACSLHLLRLETTSITSSQSN